MKRKISKRALVLLVCLTLCMVIGVGGTIAFIVTQSGHVNNTFTPANIACEVQNRFPALEGVKNTGDADCYIRVALVLNWVKSVDGDQSIYPQKPVINFTPQNGWVIAADGYYYYREKVAPTAQTGALLSLADLTAVEVNVPEEEYELSIQIVASAIQTTSEAVADWSGGLVTVDANGNLSVTTQ